MRGKCTNVAKDLRCDSWELTLLLGGSRLNLIRFDEFLVESVAKDGTFKVDI